MIISLGVIKTRVEELRVVKSKQNEPCFHQPFVTKASPEYQTRVTHRFPARRGRDFQSSHKGHFRYYIALHFLDCKACRYNAHQLQAKCVKILIGVALISRKMFSRWVCFFRKNFVDSCTIISNNWDLSCRAVANLLIPLAQLSLPGLIDQVQRA